ncbi:MAG: hypothetical protein RIB98_14850 [Acidimicrobiales bacterium]
MKMTDLPLGRMKEAIVDLPAQFTTLDVVEHPAMADAGRRFGGEPMFRALVGKQIKRRMGFWKLTELKSGTSRGSVWGKR